MKWILSVIFIASHVFAQSTLSELPLDVQKEIKSTEGSVLEAKGSELVIGEKSKPIELKPTEVVSEADIPLSLGTSKKTVAGESVYFRMIMIVALLGILACGTWIFVRRSKAQNIKRNKNEIKILAQHYLGPKKSLAVVRVAGESILVGITDAQINIIKTLSLLDDEIPEVTNQNFQSELDRHMVEGKQDAHQPNATYNRRSQIKTKTNVTDEEIEEFSIKGIKDLVSTKLKNMRSI